MNTASLFVIDNFFSQPDAVRAWGLQQKFYDMHEMTEITRKVSDATNHFPGLRSVPLTLIEHNFSSIIMNGIAGVARHAFALQGDIDIVSSFQLTTEDDYQASAVHRDDSEDHNIVLACVIYLSPNAPYNAGTSLYSPNHDLVDCVGNVYNRLVMYKAGIDHRAEKYFGHDLQTGRLMITSFIRKL